MSTAPRFIVSTKELPPAERAAFLESSFFSRNGPGAELPSPTDVRARSAIQNPGAQQRTYRIPPVRYEELGLIVKFGRAPRVTVEEGQCLWALRHALPEVPVPEVYGWTHDDDQVFIYMELVQGVSLEQRWESLNEVEREGVCQQLLVMLSELRKVQHATGEFFLGRLNRQPPSDIIFESPRNNPPGGPFHSVAEFHDWLSILIRTGLEQHWPGKKPSEIPDPGREHLPDDAPVVLTHGDLHPSNIMVSTDTPCEVVSIIDWHQSGWYPDYWEFCKAAFTAEVNGEWMDRYIPLFLDDSGLFDVWNHYAGALGY
ncbi:kinase-like protein [Trichocladium antarcticum]|uniref:Kinase-like protein n=1 Tax=Trichocladium antarcticum TaxID=1450529 RepID=A0AAN6UBZ9_9PEZI|nr:kinase-like protein [Trichocladium antarcticum]